MADPILQSLDELLQEPALIVQPDLSELATRQHLHLLAQIRDARDVLDRMLWLVSREPHEDAQFDVLDAHLGQLLQNAGVALLQFRDRRECQGEA
jgi:hypothetical protein